MTANKLDSQARVCLLVLLLVGLGSEASFDTQDRTVLRQRRQSLQCSPYNEVGSVCTSVLGAGNISTFGNISAADNRILRTLGSFQNIPGLNSRCPQLYFAITCMTSNTPCESNVWCASVDKTGLEAMINESCRCTGVLESLCAVLQTSLVYLVRILPNLHRTDQVPAQTQCIDVNIGEDIVVPTSVPATPPFPGLQCSHYNEVGSVCTSVLGAGNISILGNVSETDNNILTQLRLYPNIPGLTSRCQQLSLAIACMASNAPCSTNVWCASVDITGLEAMVNESCTCTGVAESLCTQIQTGLVYLLRILPNLHRTGQAPPQRQCIDVNIGEDIVVPTSVPATPPFPGLACEPYSGSVCSAVLGGQPVRTPNHTESESRVQVILEGAKLLNGGNLTMECEKALLAIICPASYFACAGSVWCSSNGAFGLATMLNNSCVCPESASTQCESGKDSISSQAISLAYSGFLYPTDRVPSSLQCQILPLGTQGSAAPLTSQTHFYTVFTAALMILVGMMV